VGGPQKPATPQAAPGRADRTAQRAGKEANPGATGGVAEGERRKRQSRKRATKPPGTAQEPKTKQNCSFDELRSKSAKDLFCLTFGRAAHSDKTPVRRAPDRQIFCRVRKLESPSIRDCLDTSANNVRKRG